VHAIAAAAVWWCCAAHAGLAQSFPNESRAGAGWSGSSYATADPAPRMMEPAEEIGRPLPRRRYIDPRFRGRGAEMTDLAARRFAQRAPQSRLLSRPAQSDAVMPGSGSGDPFVETMPAEGPMFPPSGDEFPAVAPSDGSYDSTPPGSRQYVGRPPAEEAYPGGPPTDAPFVDHYASDGPWVDSGAADCGGCGRCEACHAHDRLFPCVRDWWHCPCGSGALGRNIYGIGAAQAFKGPPDLGQNGNFGVYYGANWGFPLLTRPSIGGQFGASVAWSDFQGGTGLVDHSRTQWFVTGGLFHRAPCNQGLQGGAVLDYLNDEFYVTMNLLQIRAEIGYLWNCHELGIWSAAHTKSDSAVAPATFGVPTVTWQANDQYNLYYRFHYGYAASGRMWVGLTGDGDVVFGGATTAPLNEQWAVQVAYNYMVPKDDPGVPNAVKETWGLTIGTVWYPRCKTPNCKFDPFRPLFTTADNSTFWVKTK
jgi:hypothetical protein